MTEKYTDYDLENTIRQFASRLKIAGCSAASGKPLDQLFSEIENSCPEAATILLEYTHEKDKLKDYLDVSPPFRVISGNIIGEGDATFDKYWDDQVALYPKLLEALEKCAGKWPA